MKMYENFKSSWGKFSSPFTFGHSNLNLAEDSVGQMELQWAVIEIKYSKNRGEKFILSFEFPHLNRVFERLYFAYGKKCWIDTNQISISLHSKKNEVYWRTDEWKFIAAFDSEYSNNNLKLDLEKLNIIITKAAQK